MLSRIVLQWNKASSYTLFMTFNKSMCSAHWVFFVFKAQGLVEIPYLFLGYNYLFSIYTFEFFVYT